MQEKLEKNVTPRTREKGLGQYYQLLQLLRNLLLQPASDSVLGAKVRPFFIFHQITLTIPSLLQLYYFFLLAIYD